MLNPSMASFPANLDLVDSPFQPFSTDALHLFQQYYPLNHFGLSDLSPTSLWIWRKPYEVAWTIRGGLFCLRCCHLGETYYLPPVGPSYDRLPQVLQSLALDAAKSGNSLRFRAVPYGLLGRLGVQAQKAASISEDRANWDYLYQTSDLVELKGRKYQTIRNQIHKFQNSCQYHYLPLTPELFPQAEKVFFDWAGSRLNEITVQDELSALHEAFEAFDPLHLQGGIINIGDEAVAFAIGSLLRPDMAQIHFQKARPDMTGAYAVISHEHICNAWSGTSLINWEDDLGLPGLREAKRRYHPIQMVEKYVVDLS